MRIQWPLSLAAATLVMIVSVAALQNKNAAAQAQAPAPPARIESASAPAMNRALAEPLLNRIFSSSCLADKTHFYRESLEFSADGTTRFSRTSFNDAACQSPLTPPTIRKGQYALAPEEEGRLLLMVRHLQSADNKESTPYFEALIRVDHDSLVMDNGPSPSLQYTAQTMAI